KARARKTAAKEKHNGRTANRGWRYAASIGSRLRLSNGVEHIACLLRLFYVSGGTSGLRRVAYLRIDGPTACRAAATDGGIVGLTFAPKCSLRDGADKKPSSEGGLPETEGHSDGRRGMPKTRQWWQ